MMRQTQDGGRNPCRLIGVSPQETAIAPNLSARENLALICGIHGFSREKTEARIRALSDRIGVMKGGRLLAAGTAEELKRMTGADDFEAAFVSLVKGASA